MWECSFSKSALSTQISVRCTVCVFMWIGRVRLMTNKWMNSIILEHILSLHKWYERILNIKIECFLLFVPCRGIQYSNRNQQFRRWDAIILTLMKKVYIVKELSEVLWNKKEQKNYVIYDFKTWPLLS